MPHKPALPPVAPTLRAPARGTLSAPSGRFEALAREWAHDGWDIDEDEQTIRREVAQERSRTAISYNQSPDLGFDRAINPYRGCEHGCIYCYARPTHSYIGLSPGIDFETRLTAKPDVAAALERELGRKGYQVAPMALGTNTDPWQPIEARYRITRQVLEVLHAWKHPVTITTRGALIGRDLDLLGAMAAEGLAQVGISITTLDAGLARAMEPRAPTPSRRLAAIRALADAGVPVQLMMAPVIPGLTDHEVEPILRAARDAGAQVARWILLRLPHEVSPLFRDWLDRHRPERAERVMNLVREMRGGRDNDSGFGTRFRGQGPNADMLRQRVAVARRRLGYDDTLPPLDCSRFRAPPRAGDQLSLF